MFVIVVLLPGFIIIRLKHATRVHAPIDQFESTIQSLSYSVVIVGVWFAANYIYERVSSQRYPFWETDKQILLTGNYAALFNGSISLRHLVFSYFAVFLIVSFGVFIGQWINAPFRIRKSLGFDSFSEQLTPWEDFAVESKLKWVGIDVNDGHTYLGLISRASYVPYDHELVITGYKSDAIKIYYKGQPELHDKPPDQVYINGTNIVSMSSFPRFPGEASSADGRFLRIIKRIYYNRAKPVYLVVSYFAFILAFIRLAFYGSSILLNLALLAITLSLAVLLLLQARFYNLHP